jgi:hypothetical protein
MEGNLTPNGAWKGTWNATLARIISCDSNYETPIQGLQELAKAFLWVLLPSGPLNQSQASVSACIKLTVFGYPSRPQIVPKPSTTAITRVDGIEPLTVLEGNGIAGCQNGYQYGDH